jgi:hypothetical protein
MPPAAWLSNSSTFKLHGWGVTVNAINGAHLKPLILLRHFSNCLVLNMLTKNNVK